MLPLLLCGTAGCERAGAVFENRTSGTVLINDPLKLEEKPAGYASSLPVALPSNMVRGSVWRVDERQFIDISTSTGKRFRFAGASLNKLADDCPKHCILQITDDGVRVVPD
jgi:hypothetical protein